MGCELIPLVSASWFLHPAGLVGRQTLISVLTMMAWTAVTSCFTDDGMNHLLNVDGMNIFTDTSQVIPEPSLDLSSGIFAHCSHFISTFLIILVLHLKKTNRNSVFDSILPLWGHEPQH